MNWELHVAGPARKDLKRLEARDRERILAALAAMREDPFSGDIARLKGEQPSAMRRRVGDWRILFDVHPDRNLVVIVGIRRRTSTTY